MSLREWLNNGWIRAHRTSREEIGSLLRIADRDLKDSRAAGVSSDNRFVMAYNAALQSATAALAASGYRTEREIITFARCSRLNSRLVPVRSC